MRRGGALGRGGAVMIKVAKPNQDMRFDVPVIGRETISVAAEAKVRVIALEASRTLLLEKQDVILAAGTRENFALWPLSPTLQPDWLDEKSLSPPDWFIPSFPLETLEESTKYYSTFLRLREFREKAQDCCKF